jgi:Tfp pilus assembly protein PilF
MSVDAMVAHADARLRAGDWRDAVDILRRALTLEEGDARAHAVLALALLAGNRLSGAESEARRALELDGGSAHGHYAIAAVLHARGHDDEAWQYCAVAIEDSIDHDTDIAVHVLGAAISEARKKRRQARTLLESILHRAPSSTTARLALARIELADGRLAEAARLADDALRDKPRDPGAHVIAGLVDLAQGDVDAAERHARFALSENATHPDAIRLWSAIKTRKNRALGTLWRFNTWLGARSDDRQVALLVGAYLVVQLCMILVGRLGYPMVQPILLWVWVGFCIYSWYAPVLFEKLLAREITGGQRDP